MTGAVAAPAPASVRIQPFTPDLCGAVRAFNQRLAAGGVGYQFPADPATVWLPKVASRRLYQELFLAVEGGTTVRGGYILKRQDFSIGGATHQIAFYHLPLSEGLVDRAHGAIGLRLLTDALKREPRLFVLGIGSLQEPLSRMVTAMGWRLEAVPFCFKVMRPFRVARGLTYLRARPMRRLGLDAVAFTGAAWLAARLDALRTGRPGGEVTATVEPRFGAWSDDIWADCRDRYAFVGSRDRASLEILYPPDDPRFIRVLATRGGRAIGWAVLLATAMRDHKYFGNLQVGSIVDCLAAPEQAAAVVAAAVGCLETRGVDLIVSNQLSEAWVRGLELNGFRRGPSTFLFGLSKSLRQLVGADAPAGGHINRGDGDGPINL